MSAAAAGAGGLIPARVRQRLWATIATDAKLQFRYGFYYAGIFLAAFFIVVVRQFSPASLRPFMPPVLLQNLTTTTFYFIAGLVLLEKSEGTIEGLVVTPLRTSEYLFSKTVTLAFLAVAETLIVAALGYGFNFRLLPAVAGMLAMSVMLVMFGFVVIARYDSVTDYLLPSAFWTLWLALPLLHYFDLWPHWILYLVPSHAPLLLLKAGFFPVESWEIIYGVGYSLLWAVVFSWWAAKSFQRFVIRKEGTG